MALGIAVALIGFLGGQVVEARAVPEGGVSVSYPPGNKELSIPPGQWMLFEIHSANRTGEDVYGEVYHEGLATAQLDYPESFYMESGREMDIPIHIMAGSETTFSGMVHVEFKTDSTIEGIGGKIIQSFGIPIAGKASAGETISRREGVPTEKPSTWWNKIGYVGIGIFFVGVGLAVSREEF